MVTVLFEKQSVDKKNKQIKTSIKIAVKGNMLAAFFQDNAPAARSGSAQFMVYIFAGRQAVKTEDGSSGGGSTQTFLKKETRIQNQQQAEKVTETSAQEGNTMTASSQLEKCGWKSTTGGSDVQKDAVVVGNTKCNGFPGLSNDLNQRNGCDVQRNHDRKWF